MKLHNFELHHFHWALVHVSTFSQTKKFLNIGHLVALVQFEEQTYQCHDHILKFSFLFQPFPSTKFLFLFNHFLQQSSCSLFNHFLQQSSCSYSTISFNKVLILIQPFPSTFIEVKSRLCPRLRVLLVWDSWRWEWSIFFLLLGWGNGRTYTNRRTYKLGHSSSWLKELPKEALALSFRVITT